MNRRQKKRVLERQKKKTEHVFQSLSTTGPAVSIHTVSQGSRTGFLNHCWRYIQYQTYENITEWVVGNGSRDFGEAETLRDWFQNLGIQAGGQWKTQLENVNGDQDSLSGQTQVAGVTLSRTDFPQLVIRLLPWLKPRFIGEVRQEVNKACSGKIIVSFDDDDIYPHFRVAYAVQSVQKSSRGIAGSSAVNLFDTSVFQMMHFQKLSNNHSTHNSLAYTKDFAEKNTYGTEKNYAEESKFCGNFQLPIYQMDPKLTVLQLIHSSNTFEKSMMVTHALLNSIKEGIDFKPSGANMKHTGGVEAFRKALGEIYHGDEARAETEFQRILRDREEAEAGPVSEFDYTFFAGIVSQAFDPRSMSLGGSEQAIVQIARILAQKKGTKVVVYGNFEFMLSDQRNLNSFKKGPDGEPVCSLDLENVIYIHSCKFPYRQKHKNLIIWRMSGSFVPLMAGTRAEKVFFDVHDNCPVNYHIFDRFSSQIDALFLKSEYHKKCAQHCLGVFEQNRVSGSKNTLMRVPDKLPDISGLEMSAELQKKVHKIKVCANGVRDMYLDIHQKLMEATGDLEAARNNPKTNNIVQTIIQKKKQYTEFVYASCYSRGLLPILLFTWPLIKAAHPDAVLHCCYGKNSVPNEEVRHKIQYLMGQEGVIDHGSVDQTALINLRARASFQLYWTNTIVEIDCISVREALCLGCIPIISESSVFADRCGFKIAGEKFGKDDYTALGNKINILCKMCNTDETTYWKLLKKIINSKTITSWKATTEYLFGPDCF